MITLTNILLIVIIQIMMFGLFKFMKSEITIVYKQEFSDEDRQLIEDLYNNDGDMKDREHVMMEALDEAVRNINSIILDAEDETNG